MKTRITLVLLLILLLWPMATARSDTTALLWPPGGVDYVAPASTFTGCGLWFWLQNSCYTNTTLSSQHISPQQQLAADLLFVHVNHLGMQRIWISLDQLFGCWDTVTGYCGYDNKALASVDDVISQAATLGVPLNLVLFTNSNANGFQPQALDGNHPAMRAGYLTALHDFLVHISQDNGIGTVAVLDLLNEAYYQLETAPALKALGLPTSVLDTTVIHPWLTDLYNTAKMTAPALSYTISDTGRLLGSNQGTWVSMYPLDLYDIHLYNDNPGADAALWSTAKALAKPWFAGEVGCGSGNTACTYNGATALPVDSWWLLNLRDDGAQSVLVEDRHTAWAYTYGVPEITGPLTQVGQLIQSINNPPASATVTNTATSIPISTSTATPTPTATPTLLPWNPPVTLPHGSPHGLLVESFRLTNSTGQVIAIATKTVSN